LFVPAFGVTGQAIECSVGKFWLSFAPVSQSQRR
jgi:hypothetical protein